MPPSHDTACQSRLVLLDITDRRKGCRMAPRELSPEIVALVHHVELNKAGWWQKSLQKLIANVLWMSGDLPTAEVRDSLQSIFGVDMTPMSCGITWWRFGMPAKC